MPEGTDQAKTLNEHYVDPTRPFGHGLVLCTLLTVEDPADYPWNVYWPEHLELHTGMIIRNVTSVSAVPPEYEAVVAVVVDVVCWCCVGVR